MPQITGTPTTAGVYTPSIIATDSTGASSEPVQLQITVNTPTGSGGVPTAVMFPLPIFTELLINGTWTDISAFVYQRDDIHITGGKAARSDTAAPAQLTLTLNNRDGRFSPDYVNGQYYPYLQRNTQIRVSLQGATSSSGTLYTGYRFWGEVAEWPPLSDISGNDLYVSITANGPRRRIRQGGGEGSALQRYYASLPGPDEAGGFGLAPISYWTCEEDPDSSSIGAGVQNGINMAVSNGNPVWKAVSNFNGSAPIGVVNYSTWTGQTASFGASGNDVFNVPGTYTWPASTSTVDVRLWGGGGGGSNGENSKQGGGGGEFARSPTLAVTPGNFYTITVGAGGSGGQGSNNGTNQRGTGGTFSKFSDPLGAANTVTAHGGHGGNNTGTDGLGGTGSAAAIHFDGGAGGIGTGGTGNRGGGGGGGSGGNTSAGGAGHNNSGNTGGAGGSAGTGTPKGGVGGQGGNGIDSGTGVNLHGMDGLAPGGGGGAGGFWGAQSYGGIGGSGDSGMAQLVYSTTGLTPPANVIRWIMYVPSHGGNDKAVIMRAFTGGTIAKLDCQYRQGGNIRMFGYNIGGTQLFDSGNLSVNADGRTLMISMELTYAQSNVHWSLSALAPGSLGVGSQVVTGTLAGSLGAVSTIVVAPNQDVSKTGVGHISVQYSLIPLWKVSQALDGHQYEGTIDRFARLAAEQGLGTITEVNEMVDHWGFEDGTLQGWTAAHGTIVNSTFTVGTNTYSAWPGDGSARSLQLTADGTGSPSAQSVAGASGQPVQPGDVASASIDLYSPAGVNNAYIGLKWYDATGAFISESDCPDTVIPAGQPVTLRIHGSQAVAPAVAAGASADAQFLAVTFGDHHTDAGGVVVLYGDNVRLSPHMGPQTRKAYHEFLEEIEDLEQGIMKDAKELWGLKLRTRMTVINQPPSLNLDFSQAMISPPLAPVKDTQNVKNNIIVHRHKGTTVEVTLDQGVMSIQEPPSGVGRFKKNLKAIAAADEQIEALAAHLLSVGTAPEERYPTVTVDLRRASIAGNSLAPWMAAVAGVEIGDRITLSSLPFWFPSATSEQLVIGYDELLNARNWVITFNCITYTPYIQLVNQVRRW